MTDPESPFQPDQLRAEARAQFYGQPNEGGGLWYCESARRFYDEANLRRRDHLLMCKWCRDHEERQKP